MELEFLCNEYIKEPSKDNLFTLLNHKLSLRLFTRFLKWYNEGIISLSLWLKIVIQLLSAHIHKFLSHGRMILESVLEYLFDKDQITDEWVMSLFSDKDTPEQQAIYIYYLLLPSLFYENELQIERTFHRIQKALLFLISCPYIVPIPFIEIIKYYPSNITYFYTYMGLSTKIVLELYSEFFYKLCPELTRLHSNKNKKNDKIHIGFLSNFVIENHSVCRDRIGIIKHFCKQDNFRVYLFITKEFQPSEFYKLTMKEITPYQIHQVTPLTITDIMSSISLDVLVYPEIGMCPFAHLYSHVRYAPIQINTWGHSETSGIPVIDYYISSTYFETNQSNEFYSEKLITLDSLSTYYYSLHLFDLQFDLDNSKKTYAINEMYHYYGLFQTMVKLHPHMITIIHEILKNDSKAMIVIVGALHTEINYYLQNKLGHLYQRVQLYPNLSKYEYCSLIQVMDIMLDSYPFGGCNTSLDAFYFNKIVITLPSDKLNGRFTYGFYKCMDINEPICYHIEDYIKTSIYYANNPHEKNIIETKIKTNSYKLFREQKSKHDWVDFITTIT